jgi:hypothetical protein
MAGRVAETSEFDAGHQERLSQETLDRIVGLAEKIIEVHGEEKDPGFGNMAPVFRPSIIKVHQRWGITEDTPIVKQLTAPLKEAQALPAYLKTGQSEQTIVIVKPLIPQIRYKYKICYGESHDLKDRWFTKGIQIEILDENPIHAGVFERDPTDRDYTIKPMTEARGIDVILDLQDVMAEYGQHP